MLLLCSKFVCFSQLFSTHSVALTPTTFPTMAFDVEAHKNKLNKKLESESNKQLLDRYIAYNAMTMGNFFSSSYIYTNWPEATEYVKKVFYKSIPNEFNTEDVKIYIVRDPSPNAFCMEDGNIAVTVGMLYLMENEADLAATLSHEFGHYYSNHLFSDYKKQEKNKILKGFAQSSIITNIMLKKNLSNFSQKQERQADTFAINFFKRNGYAPSEIARSFTNVQKLTNKYKKLSSYRKPLIYFSTHPSDDERIETATNAFKNNTINGKKYLVDSITFTNLKKRAIDETIYLLFEQLEYDECLEMAYLQYMYHPNDEFYLFFITECLRRQMIFEKDFAERFFITGNYENLSRQQKDLEKPPVFLKGKYSKKLNSANYARSVFANLKGEIYNLSEADLANIEAKELITNDTLEFLYNEDALAYFKARIPETSCVFNIQRMLLGKPWIGDCKDKLNDTELEKDYVQTIADYGTIEQNINDYTKAPVIFFNLKTVRQSQGYSQEFIDPELTYELYAEYNKMATEYPTEVIDTQNKFNFRELRKIKNTLVFIESLGLKGFFGTTERPCDFLSIFPELSHEISKFKYRQLIFLEIIVTNPVQKEDKGMFSSMKEKGESWSANMYVVDLANKKIGRKIRILSWFSSGSKREDKIKGVLDACRESAQEK